MRQRQRQEPLSDDEMTLLAAQATPATVWQTNALDRTTRGVKDVYMSPEHKFFVTFWEHEGIYSLTLWQFIAFHALTMITDIRDALYL